MFTVCLNVTFLYNWENLRTYTTQQMKFSIKDFFSKCDQIRWKLQICRFGQIYTRNP